MRHRGAGRGFRTLSRFALIGVIGGGAAGCSSDTSRLSDPFTNPFSASGARPEPTATGSLGGESEPMNAAPAIRTPRVDTQALSAPSPTMSTRPPVAAAPSPGAVSGMNPAVSGLNPESGRTMTPRVAAPPVPAPQPRLQFGQGPKPADAKAIAAEAARKEAEARAAEARRQAEAKALADTKTAEARKLAEAKKLVEAAEARKAAEQKIAEAKAAEAKAAEARKLAEAEAKKRAALAGAKPLAKAETKPDPKLEAARKAEAEAKLARAEAARDAAKKVAEAKAAEAAAKAASKDAAKEAAKQAAKDVAAKESASKLAAKEPAAKEPAAKEPEKPVASAEPPATGSVAAASSDSFRWPAKGRVINGYGSGGNEGINISVPEGTPVKAAEEGTVAYAGSDVKGYGKLVLVRHSNGYVSAYAHNAELDVRPGDKVKRGQTIAKSGATGNVTSPQLHFEIRKGATPVDPMPHLASN